MIIKRIGMIAVEIGRHLVEKGGSLGTLKQYCRRVKRVACIFFFKHILKDAGW